jgi:hypothetical protein
MDSITVSKKIEIMKNYKNENEFYRLNAIELSLQKLESEVKKLKTEKKEIIENIIRNDK